VNRPRLSAAIVRLTRTPLRRSLTSGVIYQPLNLLLSAATIPLMLHLAGTARYGLWLAMSSLFGWASLSRGGVAEAITAPLARAFAIDDQNEVRRQIGGALRSLMMSAVAMGTMLVAVLFAVSPRSFLKVPVNIGTTDLTACLAISVVFGVIILPLGLAGVVFEAQNRNYINQIVQLGFAAAAVVALWVCAQTHGPKTLSILAILGSGPGVAALVVLWALIARERRPALDRKLIGQLRSQRSVPFLRRGAVFLAFGVVAAVVNSTDSIVIAHFIGPKAVVPYAIGFRLMLTGISLVYVLVHPFWPAFARAQATNRSEWVLRRFRHLLAIGVGAALAAEAGLFLVGQRAIHWLAGAPAVPNRSVLLVLGLYFVVQMSNAIHFTFLAGLNRVDGLGRLAVAEMIINIVLSVELVPRIGTVGAATGTLVAAAATTGIGLPFRAWRVAHDLAAQPRPAG
jgi:O-antigen/teichoic acid export membrane protein